MQGVFLRFDGSEVDRRHRASHARAERILEGDGLFRLAIEGHAERFHEGRPTEVEVPVRLSVPFLHYSDVALVELYVRTVGTCGLGDAASPREINVDGLVTVDDEGQLFLARVRNDTELKLSGPSDVLVSSLDQRRDPSVERASQSVACDGALTHRLIVILHGYRKGRVELELGGQADCEGVTLLRRYFRGVPVECEQGQALHVELTALLLVGSVHLGEAQVAHLNLRVDSGHCWRSQPVDHHGQGRQEGDGNAGQPRSHCLQ